VLPGDPRAWRSTPCVAMVNAAPRCRVAAARFPAVALGGLVAGGGRGHSSPPPGRPHSPWRLPNRRAALCRPPLSHSAHRICRPSSATPRPPGRRTQSSTRSSRPSPPPTSRANTTCCSSTRWTGAWRAQAAAPRDFGRSGARLAACPDPGAPLPSSWFRPFPLWSCRTFGAAPAGGAPCSRSRRHTPCRSTSSHSPVPRLPSRRALREGDDLRGAHCARPSSGRWAWR
jgi:hypothetical protein